MHPCEGESHNQVASEALSRPIFLHTCPGHNGWTWWVDCNGFPVTWRSADNDKQPLTLEDPSHPHDKSRALPTLQALSAVVFLNHRTWECPPPMHKSNVAPYLDRLLLGDLAQYVTPWKNCCAGMAQHVAQQQSQLSITRAEHTALLQSIHSKLVWLNQNVAIPVTRHLVGSFGALNILTEHCLRKMYYALPVALSMIELLLRSLTSFARMHQRGLNKRDNHSRPLPHCLRWYESMCSLAHARPQFVDRFLHELCRIVVTEADRQIWTTALAGGLVAYQSTQQCTTLEWLTSWLRPGMLLYGCTTGDLFASYCKGDVYTMESVSVTPLTGVRVTALWSRSDTDFTHICLKGSLAEYVETSRSATATAPGLSVSDNDDRHTLDSISWDIVVRSDGTIACLSSSLPGKSYMELVTGFGPAYHAICQRAQLLEFFDTWPAAIIDTILYQYLTARASPVIPQLHRPRSSVCSAWRTRSDSGYREQSAPRLGSTSVQKENKYMVAIVVI